MSDSLELDAATLRAILDERWPDAEGERRAATDETHRLVLLHPLYDGFVSLHVTARTDLEGVFVLPDQDLAGIVTAHHRTGPLWRGQTLPVDLELHPGRVRDPATSGLLRLVDASTEPIAAPVRLTLSTDTSLGCTLAGAVDGPWEDAADFEEAVAQLRERRGTAKRLARRVDALQDGRDDPGWSRLPWGHR